MNLSYDIIVIGAGPAGLACGRVAAENGLKVLVLERSRTIGKKICAGGITRNGLIKKLPGYVAEREFSRQHIYSRFQKAEVTAKTPIIATVNRIKLGSYMADMAIQSGAEIRTSSMVTNISPGEISVLNKDNGRVEMIRYRHLVGADGSSSMVRRYLGIPRTFMGVGINYQISADLKKMEWHFNTSLFNNGYCWVFPHAGTVSVGAYANRTSIKPSLLRENLLDWAEQRGIVLSAQKATAEFINYDYRGWHFDNFFLAGDAAGFASGLTGEGIYPALVSGEAIGRYIASPKSPRPEISQLVATHKKHKRLVSISGRSHFVCTVLSELLIFALRTGLVKFDKIEMAN
ncbi:MAG: NAD(P)/FAD-dependent oxidoreductase [Deltaproteobacteria bacterium]|nr:NAD(P)/FAD-dependent oxidoreductase [Deltaproteobacteria bacterium]MBW2658846.1 NAD(P)/FAD-dependent oxidoreductase [Deltaproteobacteria bacterium]